MLVLTNDKTAQLYKGCPQNATLCGWMQSEYAKKHQAGNCRPGGRD